MFNILKHKKQKKPTEEDINKPSALNRALNNLQFRFSQRMSRYEQRFTNREKKIIFGGYFFLFAIYFSIILINIFFKFDDTENTLPNNHNITLPRDIRLPDSLNIELLRERQALKKRLDSIHQQSN